MSKTPPLLSLLVANMTDALELGLLETPHVEVDSWRAEVEASWPANADLEHQDHRDGFADAMVQAKSLFDGHHRPWGAHSPRPRRVSTVMPFRLFAQKYEALIARSATDDLARLARQKAVEPALTEAQHACTAFTACYGSASGRVDDGFRVRASSLGLGFDHYHPWVAPAPRRHAGAPQSLSTAAAQCLDRLGLVRSPSIAEPTVADALVRMTLGIKASMLPLDRRNLASYVRAHPFGIWLMRPTLIHGGNRRWVQRHADDVRSRPPCRHGRTRDLGSGSFLPAEREYKLVCGNRAELSFLSLELLTGIPQEDAGRDNSDTHFVGRLLDGSPLASSSEHP